MLRSLPRMTAAHCLLVTLLAGVGCARYEPHPVDPAAHPRDYRTRRLEDTALVAWVARYAGMPTADQWTDRQIAVAALALRAELGRARSEWLSARAAVKTAGARPAPGAQAEVERAVSGLEGSSPWVVSLSGRFTVELGGKRGARVQRARAREAVAESELVRTAHEIRSRARAAALAVTHAEEARDEAVRLLDGLRAVALLERGRFQEAALGSAELARTGAELAQARADLAALEREGVAARAALAGQLALAPGAVRSLRIDTAPPAGCRWADSLGADSILGLAALRRAEVTRTLAEYAAAEAELRLQVARQRPDLDLGPGFIWDQGVNRWTLALALPALLGFRNKAPIAEAEAARMAASAGVSQAQDAVLAEVAEAFEICRGIAAERDVADSLSAAAERLVAIALAAHERGETGLLEQSRAQLALLRAAAARQGAERRLEQAGLAVEAAAGEWRGAAAEPWPDPREPPLDREYLQ